MLSPDHRQELWVSGPLRCVLISTITPETHQVVVFNADSPVSVERCTNPEEATQIAERLWNALVHQS